MSTKRQSPGSPPPPGDEAGFLAWFKSQDENVGGKLAPDGTIEKIYFTHTQNCDSHMPRIGQLRHLKRFDAHRCDLSDAGLRWLAGQSELEELEISETKVTGPGLHILRNFQRIDLLKCINVPQINVALADIGQCKSARKLLLYENDMDDTGLEHLAALEGLEYLDLRSNPIRWNLGFLESMKELTNLVLSDIKVEHPATAHIAKVNALRVLYLDGAHLTDAGLRNLSRMPNLSWLTVQGTFTEKGIRALAEMPRLGLLTIRRTRITKAMLLAIIDVERMEFDCDEEMLDADARSLFQKYKHDRDPNKE